MENIEKAFARESSEEEFKKWELKLFKDDIMVYIKKGGSTANSEQPFVKTVFSLNSYFSMKKVVQVVSLLT